MAADAKKYCFEGQSVCFWQAKFFGRVFQQTWNLHSGLKIVNKIYFIQII